ncbi:hypothetical protein EIN_141370 [Entamoeba invadens IP1]|uniref:Uncharacterized protein n=1 Tax=Entamoeba invadens IP1 TaxID=370355 RepID=A0A0A1UFC4_ENTIV|nr:hypothetical protein EIN_141370 [Entamoeba invadens IP1]ELP95295.1 hypothetical protein EIN_141370 [Entamoeba invadens IP1]|eukprot:XP_004262066.1 hypothetical protein EIN_141370 [Entamoeba invadens IP1]
MTMQSRYREKIRCINERTLLTHLQCALLAFISTKAGVVLCRPPKKSGAFHTNFSTFIPSHLQMKTQKKEKLQQLIKDGGFAKKCNRQIENEKKRDTIHILEDILFEDGFVVFYDNENREGIRGNVFIQMPNGELLNKDMIVKLGEAVWNYCTDKMNDDKKPILIQEKVVLSQAKVMEIINNIVA